MSIKNAQIKASGGRPANFSSPTHLISGSPKSVGAIKGGPNSGIQRKSEYFMKSGASGRVSIKGGQN